MLLLYKTEDYVSVPRIPRAWFNFFSGFFIVVVLLITAYTVYEVFGAKNISIDIGLQRVVAVMTLIIGYFFIVARILNRIALIGLTEGKNVAIEEIRAIIDEDEKATAAEKSGAKAFLDRYEESLKKR